MMQSACECAGSCRPGVLCTLPEKVALRVLSSLEKRVARMSIGALGSVWECRRREGGGGSALLSRLGAFLGVEFGGV